MKRSNYFVSLAVLLLAFGCLTGCKKDKETAPAPTEQDFAAAKSTYDVINEVQSLNSLALAASSKSGNSPGGRIAAPLEDICGTFTIEQDESNGAIIISVDYGTKGVECNGEIRKGKLVFTYLFSTTDETTASITAQFIGYEADGKKLDGDYALNMSYDQKAQLINYTCSFKNAVLTYADKTTVNWNSNYTLKLDISKSSLAISGGLSGKDKHGKTFSADITSPLIMDGCKYGVTKGIYLFKAEGYQDAALDFGNGDCDNVATLNINGHTEQITLED